MPGDPAEDLLQYYVARRLGGTAEPEAEFLSAHAEHADALRGLLRRLAALGVLPPPADATADQWPSIDGFTIVRVLGQGGMGVVYEAWQSALERTVAIKVLHGAAPWSPNLLERFQREITALARMDHPNIVRVHGSGTVQGAPFVVMQRVEGEPLSGWLPAAGAGPVNARVAGMLRLGAKLARALAHVHELGVVHRDVKPPNVIVDVRGEPILVDFGLARDAERDSITMHGEFVGTLAYTAPEQAMGERVDRRADVFGLGATLYHLLAGSPPYAARTVSELVRLIQAGPPTSPARLNHALPRDLVTVLEHATAPAPKERYASAADLADDLEALLDGRPIAARRIGRLERTWRWARRRPAAAGLVVTTAVVLVLASHVLEQAWVARLYEHAEEYAAKLDAADTSIRALERDDAERDLAWCCAERPDDPQPWLLRVINAVRTESGGMTRRLASGDGVQRALTLLESAPPTLRVEPAGRLMSALLAAGSKGRIDDDHWIPSDLENPSDPAAALRLALVRCYLIGDRTGALADLEQILLPVAAGGATTATPEHAALTLAAHSLKAAVLWDSGSLDGYRSAVLVQAARPRDPRALITLARYLVTFGHQAQTHDAAYAQQRFGEAAALARQAMALQPENTLTMGDLAWVLQQAQASGWQEESVELYRRSIAQSTGLRPVSRWNLHNALWSLKLGAPRDFVDLLEPIADYYGHRSDYWWDLAWAKRELEGLAAAVAVSERGLGEVAEDERYRLLGLIAADRMDLRDDAQHQAALADWDRCFDLAPDDADGMDKLALALGGIDEARRERWVVRCLRLHSLGTALGQSTLDVLQRNGRLEHR